MGRLLSALCTGAVLLSSLVSAVHASPAGELLARADAVRSADRQEFDVLLSRAGRLRGQATANERDLLDYLLAYQAVLDGRYADALRSSQRLYKDGRDPDIRYRAALLVANTTAITRDHVTGLRYLSFAFALAGQTRTPELRLHGDVVAAALYTQFGQPELALRYASRVLAQNPPLRVACFAHENRARALVELRQGVTEDFARAAAACERAGETLLRSLVYSSEARFLAASGRQRAAVRRILDTLPAANEAAYTRLTGELHATLAESQLALGNTSAAMKAAKEVLRVGRQEPHWAPFVTAHRVLYQIAERSGDHHAALEHYRAYHEAERARLDEVKAREYAFQMSRLDALRREQQAEALQQRNRALVLQQRISVERGRSLRMAVVLLGLLVVIVAYWAWQYRRTHHTLRRLSQTDTLSGVATRGHFAAEATAIILDCARRKCPVSVLLLDVDHFKQINDQCGHAVGDWVLRNIAQACQSACPPGSLVGRMGGEEFAVIMRGVSGGQAVEVAERLRVSVRAIDAFAGGCHLQVTASVGVACNQRSGYDYEALLGAADRAMYSAKRGGRDRVGQACALDRCA
ncbi:diguanylate cyclase [Lysobacter sp. N42]|uniref:GGDEF domain-containing protein n=1 Tax=Lysobacter sp. N42 TaxID=2545719 RepID=UPI001404ACDA|nr:GGDEF domain-containing protein [Lysobacter sp. N42]